jgi:hypothetical protein
MSLPKDGVTLDYGGRCLCTTCHQPVGVDDQSPICYGCCLIADIASLQAEQRIYARITAGRRHTRRTLLHSNMFPFRSDQPPVYRMMTPLVSLSAPALRLPVLPLRNDNLAPVWSPPPLPRSPPAGLRPGIPLPFWRLLPHARPKLCGQAALVDSLALTS